MIDVHADATLPVSPDEAFAVATDLEAADWLPAIRQLRHASGPRRAVGERFDVEVGMVGRHLRGVLVCRELDAPRRAVWGLEDGLDLTVELDLEPVQGGCHLDLGATYTIRGAFGGAAERASAGSARREVARAVEQLSARFARKGTPT